MIPTRWSSAIAILRRRLRAAAEERAELREQLRRELQRDAGRSRIDLPIDRDDALMALERELFGEDEPRHGEPRDGCRTPR